MPSYTLHYLDARGRGEVARLIFAHSEVTFTDKRYKFEEWPSLKQNTKLFPFGQSPTLEVDGEIIAQSSAMCRFLAAEYGLVGNSVLENAKIDMLVDQFTDIRVKLSPFYYSMSSSDDPEKIKQRKEFCENYLPVQLTNIERLLNQNNEGSGHFVGDKLTWCDLAFMDLVQVLEEVDENALAEFTLLKAHVARIRDLPNIKKYLSSRPVSIF